VAANRLSRGLNDIGIADLMKIGRVQKSDSLSCIYFVGNLVEDLVLIRIEGSQAEGVQLLVAFYQI